MSFKAQQMMKHVYLLQSQTASGVNQWHYLTVTPHKEPLFLRASQNGAFDCAEFGTVLASGIGETPPAHVWWELKERAK